MLDALRKSAGSWFVKALLGLLVISFAIWGVGDIFRGGAQSTVAEVGGRKISPQEFQRDYQNQIGMASNQLGRQLTSAEARTYGLGQRVLENLIGTTAIDIHADTLALGISDAAVASAIQSERSFQGANGAFDPQRFQEVLRNVGMNEPGFVALQREEMIRRQIVGALSRGAFVSKTLLDASNNFRNDERVLKFFVLPPSVAGEVAAPEDAALKTYYEERKAGFKAPEYRKIGILSLTPDAIKDTIAVTDEEVKESYEATKATYGTPERRTIEKLVFKDMAAAREGAAKLAGGMDFLALGKELGLKDSDIALGTFSKAQLADRKIADAAFAVEKDKPSEPVDSFASVIVRVTDIVPGTQKGFEEVKDQVRDALAKSRASAEIAKLYDAIEDERANGAKVAEAAKKLNLKYDERVIDARGLGPDSQPDSLVSANRDALRIAFESDVGVENNPVTVGDGYLFLDVEEITPERRKSFEEVSEAVKTAWLQDESRKRVRAKADELVEKGRAGTSIETLAEPLGAKVETTPPLKREAAPQGLPRTAIPLAFTLPQDGLGTVQMPDRVSQAILQVVEIKPAPALDEKQAEALGEELRRGVGVDILTQYVGGLQKSYGVQVNPGAISSLIGQ